MSELPPERERQCPVCAGYHTGPGQCPLWYVRHNPSLLDCPGGGFVLALVIGGMGLGFVLGTLEGLGFIKL